MELIEPTLKKKFIGAINVHLDVEVGMNAELL